MLPLIYEFYGPAGVAKSKNVSNSSRLVLEEAERLGIGWEILSCTQLIELTYRGKSKTYHHQIPASTTAVANYTCRNKKVTTSLLYNNGISVPRGFRISHKNTAEYLKSAFHTLQKPVVVKPSDGSWGEAITVNINTFQDFLTAVDAALDLSGGKRSTAIVEEMFQGTEYRILATKEKVIGVLHRRPASVVGDGKSSIKKLIKQKNTNQIRGIKGGTTSHLKIRMDAKMLKLLQEQGRDFDSVPPNGERVFLRLVSNISQGGDAIDFTDKVHPSVKEISLRAIQAIPGLSFAGIDFMSKDITKEQTSDMYVIIEINDSPGFDIHDYPYKGKNRHTAREFLYLIFPELKQQKRKNVV